MTSQINPNNIDGAYPVPGVPNNSQGMRDNFTNTKTNFQYAATEITDLQTNGVFKAALTGTTLDNNMNDNEIYAVKLRDVSWTEVKISASSGTITLDYSAGNYQAVPYVTGNISLGFANWPVADSVGSLRFAIVVSNVAYTLTLPSAVSVGVTTINGLNTGTNIITFPATGTYVYEFETADGGSTISIQNTIEPTASISNQVTIANTTASTTSSTGALIVAGGVGVGGNVNVGGLISAAGNITSAGRISSTGNIYSAGSVLLSSTGTVGYTAGAGGTVSQSGNKSGGVTLNKPSGEITMQNTSLSAATTVNFVLTNSSISATDLLVINQTSTANSGGYYFNAICGAGNANIAVRNIMSSAASDAIVLRYAVVKGSIT